MACFSLAGFKSGKLFAQDGHAGGIRSKAIPASGERIPVIGMGTWLTFNVPTSGSVFRQRLKVLERFFELGGGMIDSSPMYGNAEAAIGAALPELKADTKSLFAATKVWSASDDAGRGQFENSFRLWGRELIDLQQVHNLVNWQSHLKMLREAKEEGRIRYVGVTTSHGRRHDELKRILQNEPLDFVQLTYNAGRPEAEPLIQLAADKGVAVIANRPLGGGGLIDRLQRKPLPSWAADAGIHDWPDFLLRWIVSHPDVTCAIPASSQVVHMEENMRAGYRPALDAKLRRRMRRYVEAV
ncbi:aldo/keto reductase [Coraliomargarita sinensis]|nr:aldo/keto reductase [Coraliomargarita sinensis]